MTSQTVALALVRMGTAKHLDEEPAKHLDEELVDFDEALVDIEEQLAELEEEEQLAHLDDSVSFAMQDVAALEADSARQGHESPQVVSHNPPEVVATLHARKSSSYAELAACPTYRCQVLFSNTIGGSIGKHC